MQVVLLERVEKLGQMGDVVTVKNGYARNFLLPQGKALRATKSNLERFENERAQLEATNLERKSEAQSVADKLDGQKFIIIRQAGESGHLYGSVNARDIADAATAGGFTVARNQVVMDKVVKTLGLTDITIRLHPEVIANITVNVARTEEEADLQAQGKSINALEAEEDELNAEELFESEEAASALDESEEADETVDASAEEEKEEA